MKSKCYIDRERGIVCHTYDCHGICVICGTDKDELKKEKPINSGYPLLADVLAEIDESVGLRYGYANWRVAVELVLSKYFS